MHHFSCLFAIFLSFFSALPFLIFSVSPPILFYARCFLLCRFRGDYRTGKRLNMRKVIPYIASQFRKDKIWLRRTKKSRRQYQILLAVDDSSSMGDNHSKQVIAKITIAVLIVMIYLFGKL